MKRARRPSQRLLRRTACGGGRGFALPLVLLLAVVAALGIVVLLERHAVTYMAMMRHVRGYTTYHQSAGLREVFNRWMPTARGRLNDVLGDGGLAFRLKMPKSGYVDVYMADGQNTILSKTTGLSGRQREILEDALAILNDPPPELRARMPEDRTALFRTVGPATVNVATADPAVIEAICLAVLADPGRAHDAAVAIMRRTSPDEIGLDFDSRRDRGKSSKKKDRTPLASSSRKPGEGAAGQPGGANPQSPEMGGQVGRALMELSIDPSDIREIETMFVEHNTLWMVVAETLDDNGHILDRSGGLYEGSEGRSDTLNQNAGFLSWETLPLE